MIRSTIRKAQKVHQCEPCGQGITPGELHRESVASPDHDDLGNEGWWRMRECADCCKRYERPVTATS